MLPQTKFNIASDLKLYSHYVLLQVSVIKSFPQSYFIYIHYLVLFNALQFVSLAFPTSHWYLAAPPQPRSIPESIHRFPSHLIPKHSNVSHS